MEYTYEQRIKWFIENYYESGMEYEGLLVSMKDTDLNSFQWYGETISIPKYGFTKPTLETYKELEDNEVYIHYLPEHYDDGSNLNFSIEFRKQKTQTGWYNDNHEFGDVSNTMRSSMMIALWYLQDTNRIELINSGYHNPDYIKYNDELKDFINQIILS
jgi:hypothetical protein